MAKKLITAVRIREDRAENLQGKVIEIVKNRGVFIRESDLVNKLIDECLDAIDWDGEELVIDKNKL